MPRYRVHVLSSFAIRAHHHTSAYSSPLAYAIQVVYGCLNGTRTWLPIHRGGQHESWICTPHKMPSYIPPVRSTFSKCVLTREIGLVYRLASFRIYFVYIECGIISASRTQSLVYSVYPIVSRSARAQVALLPSISGERSRRCTAVVVVGRSWYTISMRLNFNLTPCGTHLATVRQCVFVYVCVCVWQHIAGQSFYLRIRRKLVLDTGI